MMHISTHRENFALKEKFTISRGGRTRAETLVVKVLQDGTYGRGECLPYSRYGETMDSVEAQINALPANINLNNLPNFLPSGAARNAVDCALWDWEAKHQKKRIWELLDMPCPQKALSAYTLSLDNAENMAKMARKNAFRPILKIKLGTPDDIKRLEAVRQNAPDSQIIIDANEGWDADIYRIMLPDLLRFNVQMIEQPLPAAQDSMLLELERPIPICADESCHDRNSLPSLAGKYDMINIKLDKTGGLSEARALKAEAQEKGYAVMIGCMVSSSLGIAPATLLTEGATYIDLDAPLLLAEDRMQALEFNGGYIMPPKVELWG